MMLLLFEKRFFELGGGRIASCLLDKLAALGDAARVVLVCNLGRDVAISAHVPATVVAHFDYRDVCRTW